MPTFDASHYDPPAPIAVVTLRDGAAGNSASDVVLLLDTGADVTLLPKAAVERLGMTIGAGERMELMGFDGSRSFVPLVTLDMLLLGHIFRGKYLVIDAERGILGRDVLNHFALVIDGRVSAHFGKFG
jgi:hypothetical protein